jgi:hypothetical protein
MDERCTTVFNTTLIAKNNFTTGNVTWARSTSDSSKVLANIEAAFQVNVQQHL